MHTVSKQKVLIIGLDGGTWKIYKPLIEKGYMPTLKRLVESGSSGILKSTIPPITAPAWVSYLTGVHPDKHGIFDFTSYKPGTYSTHFINGANISYKTLWDMLSEANKKVISVNVPGTYPPKPINGVLIADLLTPSTDVTFTYPPDLKKEVFDVIGEYKIAITGKEYSLYGLGKFIHALNDAEEKRINIMKHLLNKYEWDVAMLHIHSTDVLQHYLYHIIDEQHSLHNTAGIEKIYEFYSKLDEGIGELISTVPEETLKVVISDHGFMSVDRIVNVNAILEDNGFLKIDNSQKRLSRLLRIGQILKKYDRFNIAQWILGKKRKQSLIEHVSNTMIDFKNTQAFSLNGWVYGYIYINLEGREKFGIVNKQDYDSVRNAIIDRFNKFIDPRTGKKIFKAFKKEDVFNNTHHAHAPDIIIKPLGPYEFSASLFYKEGEFLTKNEIRKHHTGVHDEDGMVIFAGKDIVHKEIDANIVDVMPTILWYTGLSIPKYLDGCVITEAFNKDFAEKQKICISDVEEDVSRENVSKENNSEEIAERLKGLGYL